MYCFVYRTVKHCDPLTQKQGKPEKVKKFEQVGKVREF